MSENSDTIQIKKESLWKYTTFVLLALLIVGAFIFFQKGNSTGNSVANNGNGAANVASQGTGVAPDLSFIENSKIYPFEGPNDAKVTIVEFADFQCPFCGLASGLPSWAAQYQTSQYGDLVGVSEKIEKLAEQGKIRFVFVTMNFLDHSSTPAGSTFAGEAGLCANEQGKFWEMHAAIFTNQVPPAQEGVQFTKAQLETMAQKISGLDQTKFNSCLESDSELSAIQQSAAQASTVVSGTPAFFVNGNQAQSSWADISSKLQSLGVQI